MKNQTVPRKASRGMGASQARLGWGSKVADSEPRPLLRVQGAKVALAKVSEASRKVRVQPHFDSSISKLKMGRGKRAGHWRAVVFSQMHIDDGTGDWSGGGNLGFHHKYTDYTNDFLSWRATYFTNQNPGRVGTFHWCLFGHNSDDESGTFGTISKTNLGWSQGGGDSFFIADETRSDYIDQAHTFMHEIGHNFNLVDNTGGAMDEDTRKLYYTPTQWNTVISNLDVW